MKLKSKITIGMLVILLVSLTACCTMILTVSKKHIIDSAVNYTVTEVERLEDNLLEKRADIEKAQEVLTANTILKYYFSKQIPYADADTEYVLLGEDETIYNNSGLNVAAILEEENDNDTKYESVHLAEGDYIVSGKNLVLGNRNYQIYVVYNVTTVYHQIWRLIHICVTIGFAVSIIAIVCIVLFLRQSLEPLERLKKEADAISEGNYKGRIEITGQDELAALSRSFNKMVESVEQHISEVEEISEARKRMIYALSHEMKTPVTAISGYSYALRSVKMNEEQQYEALEFIELEAKRLERLSGKLTELVGLSSNINEFTKIDLQDMKKQLEMIMSGRDRIHLQFEKGSITGDMDLLLMLITNLCDNAWKAGATEILVKVTGEGIWVRDNGKGISENDKKHIFDVFYQGDASRNEEGFGLGLALCQKIAELHHTRLHVDSEEGKGSTFYLYNSFTTL